MATYDKIKLLSIAESYAENAWKHAQAKFMDFEIIMPNGTTHTGITIGRMPPIIMNARLTSTAGRYYHDSHIELSCYLFERNLKAFQDIIIPHELCHDIAWRIFQEKGHGKAWKETMIRYGIPPNMYHNLKSKSEIEGKRK